MTSAEVIAFWAAIACYALATIAIIAGLTFKRREWVERANLVAAIGLAAHAVAIGVRWSVSGHFPYIEDYENVLVGAFVMAGAYALVSWRWKGLAVSGALVLPVVLITCGYGITQAGPAGPVTPPYQSSWLVIHVTFAWITYAAYSIVAGLAIAMLLRERAERRGVEAKGVPAWVPPSERIDDLSLKFVAFGFLNNAVMISSGAIWAFRLWGSYWSWDPVETWSLLTWLAYGFYLHARLTLGWRGRRLAWIAVFALFGIMMVFWGVQLVPSSYHLFRNLGETLGGSSRPM